MEALAKAWEGSVLTECNFYNLKSENAIHSIVDFQRPAP